MSDKKNSTTKIVYENCRNPDCKQREDQFSIKYRVQKSDTDGKLEIIVEKGGQTHRPEPWLEPGKVGKPVLSVPLKHPCPWCGFENTFYLPVDQ